VAFETVEIRSRLNAISPIVGYRQDLAVSDAVTLELTDTTGVSTFRWLLVGRPEGSVAGGAGPEPLLLGNSGTAGFTVDTDTGFPKDGTYTVHCILNENSPTEATIKTILVRLNVLTTADGRTLRMLGAFETDEDTADALVAQGYAKMLNRWLRKLAALTAAAPFKRVTLTDGEGVATEADRTTEHIWFSWAIDFSYFTTATIKLTFMAEVRGEDNGVDSPDVSVFLMPTPNGNGGAVPTGGSTLLIGPTAFDTNGAFSTVAPAPVSIATPAGVQVLAISVKGASPAVPIALVQGPVLIVEEE
jgi:hypothetical protein